MVYKVGNPPPLGGGYGAPNQDDVQIVQWVTEELEKLSKEQSETIALELRPTTKAPEKPEEGMLVYASASTTTTPPEWDPGQGRGLYVFSGTWRKVTTNPVIT